jgi:RNA polymerase sigma factor for flagellar operon FliA
VHTRGGATLALAEPSTTPPARKAVLPPLDRAEAVRRYAPLVKHVVDRIAVGLPKIVDMDDLMNAAVIGLLDALDKYDESKGTKFETYAVWRIRGAVLDELRTMDWASRSLRRKARAIEKMQKELIQKLGRPATDMEIADAMRMDPHEMYRIMEDVKGTVFYSLDQAGPEDERGLSGLMDSIEDLNAPDPLGDLESAETKQHLLDAINKLPEQERLVVAFYYYEEITLKEIGETLHISESRASQVHSRALQRLRTRIRNSWGREDELAALPVARAAA